MLEPHDDHERGLQRGVVVGGAVARRLGQVEVEREQRRDEVVGETLDLAAPVAGQVRRLQEVEKRLVRVERRGDEAARHENIARLGLDADRAALLDQDAARRRRHQDVAAGLAHGAFQRHRQHVRAAHGHLRLRRAGEQGGDVVAEAAHPEIDLAQAVEEQQPRLDRRVGELALHEFKRRQRARCEQPAPGGAPFEERAALGRRQRRRRRLGDQDVAHYRAERVVPALQRGGVPLRQRGERIVGALEIGPPLQRASVVQQQGHVQLGFDVARAVAGDIEVSVPRHLGQRALEEAVGVVAKARVARVVYGLQPAADERPAFDRQHLEPSARGIGLEDQPVMPAAEDDSVIVGHGSAAPQRRRRRSAAAAATMTRPIATCCQ